MRSNRERCRRDFPGSSRMATARGLHLSVVSPRLSITPVVRTVPPMHGPPSCAVMSARPLLLAHVQSLERGMVVAEGSMTEQQKKERRTGKAVEETDGDGASAKLAKKGKKLAADVEKILDEIDAVLEENAEEFVKNYVQRGGE